jgi:hypothetical protein
MKSMLIIIGSCFSLLLTGCGPKPAAMTETVKLDGPTIVEAACGQCQLGIEGKKGCDLAIRHEGVSYFVDGLKITDLEKDNHADGGMCTTVRKAKVTGQISDGRFAATTFELVPIEKP